MTKPLTNILSRDLQPEVIDALNHFADLIDEAVNFGTHILKWDMEAARHGDEDLPIIMMFRHILELLDNVSISMRHSSVDACKPQMRTILETYFLLDYMLEEDTLNRSKAFLVCNIHKDLKLSQKFDPTHSDYTEYVKLLKKDKHIKECKPPIIKDLERYIENLHKMLERPEYVDVEAEYQRTVKTGTKNPPWYQLWDGPRKIEQLAMRINNVCLYETMYRQYSGAIHGTDVLKLKISKRADGLGDIHSLRRAIAAQELTQHALNMAILVYLLILKRVPDCKKEYAEWYRNFQPAYKELSARKFLKFT